MDGKSFSFFLQPAIQLFKVILLFNDNNGDLSYAKLSNPRLLAAQV